MALEVALFFLAGHSATVRLLLMVVIPAITIGDSEKLKQL
jgi:hypothetical protein